MSKKISKEISEKHVLNKEEKDNLLEELIGAQITIKQALKEIGIIASVDQKSLDEFMADVEKCSRCGCWNFNADLNYELSCETCTAEITEEDVRRLSAYDNDNFDDFYYDGDSF